MQVGIYIVIGLSVLPSVHPFFFSSPIYFILLLFLYHWMELNETFTDSLLSTSVVCIFFFKFWSKSIWRSKGACCQFGIWVYQVSERCSQFSLFLFSFIIALYKLNLILGWLRNDISVLTWYCVLLLFQGKLYITLSIKGWCKN